MLNCKYYREKERKIEREKLLRLYVYVYSLVLYAVLLAAAGGVGYIVREAFFVDAKKAKKSKKVEEVAERATHRDEKGEMVLDQSWIPEHHLNLSSPRKTSPKMKKRSSKK